MSAPTKGRKPGRKGIIKNASPTAALTLLKEHDSTINNSKNKQKLLNESLARKNSILCDQSNNSKRPYVSAPDSPGAARARKTIKKGSEEDVAGSRQKGATGKMKKPPVPSFEDYSSDEAMPATMPVKQVVPETIVIDSASEEENPFGSVSKVPFNGESSSNKKDIKGKGKEIPTLPIDKPAPKKKGAEKKPKKKSQEFIDERSGPEVSQHMSGSRVLIPSGFSGNPEATVYYTAVGAGSVTAISHASLHSLHVQVLALQDSMRRTAIEEERLNMDLAAAGCPPMHFPSFLPDRLNDLSGPLRLLDHFHGEEATQYRSNPTLSLFTVVRDAARDKKQFPVPIVVPWQHSPEDRGEGSSMGPGSAVHNGGDEEDGGGDEEEGGGEEGRDEDGDINNYYDDDEDEDDDDEE